MSKADLSSVDSKTTADEEKSIVEDEEHAVKKKKDKKPTHLPRTSMGEYVSTGGEPLTQLAIPLPGAADYSPSIYITKPTAPQYSIVGKPKSSKHNDFPGPKYSTEGGMVWRDRGFPMGGKRKQYVDLMTCIAPAGYMLDKILKTRHGMWTIGGRPKIMHGPPNDMVEPVDTHGFKTPGPAEYRPNSAHWRKNITKSFGLRLKKDSVDESPGPAEYVSKYVSSGPAYSLAKRLPSNAVSDTPGPAAYNIGTTIGKAVAKSMASRQPELSNLWAPSSNTYHVPSRLGEGPKYSMTYREFEKKVAPGAAQYKPNSKSLKKPPKFSCRNLCRPIYPDILNYAEYSLMQNSKVSPVTYARHKKFSDNHAPAFTMAKHISTKIEETPGPASYTINHVASRKAKRTPGKTMGIRIESKKETYGPGPAAYNPQVKTSAIKPSMSGRHKKDVSSTTPAPNNYNIRSGQTRGGISKGPNVTLKSRPSPFVYSGFRKICA